MYLPAPFRPPDRDAMLAAIRRRPLAALVAAVDGVLEAAHAPVVITCEEPLALELHLARANPLALAFGGSTPALALFQGPSAYVSPDWYESEHQVPTYDFIVVHASGTPVPLEDAALRRHLDAMSAELEVRLPKEPWTTQKLPEDRFATLRRAIRGFRLPVDRLEGKWKLSQNRSPADRRGVVSALRESDDPEARLVAEAIEAVSGSTG